MKITTKEEILAFLMTLRGNTSRSMDSGFELGSMILSQKLANYSGQVLKNWYFYSQVCVKNWQDLRTIIEYLRTTKFLIAYYV